MSPGQPNREGMVAALFAGIALALIAIAAIFPGPSDYRYSNDLSGPAPTFLFGAFGLRSTVMWLFALSIGMIAALLGLLGTRKANASGGAGKRASIIGLAGGLLTAEAFLVALIMPACWDALRTLLNGVAPG